MIQQELNRNYLDYSGLCAADGVVNATVLGKPSTAAMIKEVRIKVTANDGAAFDTSQTEGSTGCYPPVDFKSKEEKFLLGSIGNLALKAVVSIFEIENVVLVFGLKRSSNSSPGLMARNPKKPIRVRLSLEPLGGTICKPRQTRL